MQTTDPNDTWYQYDMMKSVSDETLLERKRKSATLTPEAWFYDPYRFLSDVGMGYQESPTQVTYETLHGMAQRNHIVSIVHRTIVALISNYCKLPEHEYDVGFRVKHKTLPREKYTRGTRKKIDEIQQFFLRCGQDIDLKRHDLRTWMRLILQDQLTFDQVNTELVFNRKGELHSFWYVPAITIRRAPMTSRQGTPPQLREQLSEAQYVQVYQNVPIASWYEHEMIWSIAYPRNTLQGSGYGVSPLENLIVAVTAELWAEEWNTKMFSQGSTAKGILNVKGSPNREKLAELRRQWMLQVASVGNAHRQIIMNADDLQWIPLNLSNNEMGYNEWINFLVTLICLMYGVKPETIGFHVRGGTARTTNVHVGQQNKADSEERFLRPTLQQLEDIFNSPKIMHAIDPDFEFAWYGIDRRDQEKDIKNRQTELQSWRTLNEVRLEKDLPPLPYGDMPLNATYTGMVATQTALEQQGANQGDGDQQPQTDQESLFSSDKQAAADRQSATKTGQPSTGRSDSASNASVHKEEQSRQEEETPILKSESAFLDEGLFDRHFGQFDLL